MSVDLGNGVLMPVVGFGSSRIEDDRFHEILYHAIVQNGYRHIDTASYYDNEEAIAKVLIDVFKNTEIKREDMFIVTKVWNHEKDDIKAALERSLKRLQLSYVDMYLIHWPVQYSGFKENCIQIKLPLHKQWPRMEECQKLGLTRSIGVSNFNFQLLNDLLTYAEIRPAANQIELNPFVNQYHFVEWMKKEKIVPIAYCPTGGKAKKNGEDKNNMLKDKTIVEIAEKHQKSVGEIILAWGVARGHVIIPKSTNFERQKQNIDCKFIDLTKEEIEKVNSINRNLREVPQFRIPGIGYMPIFE